MNSPININVRSKDGANSFSRDMRSSANFSRPLPEREVPPTPIKETKESRRETKRDSKVIIKFLDKIITLSIFMMFFGFPLFFTGLTFQGIVFEKQLYFYFWVLLGIVSWTAKGVITGEMNIRRTPLDIPIIGFWLAYMLATIFSIDRWHSFWGSFADPSRGLMSVTALVITYYLIFSNFDKKKLNVVLTAIIASGSVVSVWTMLAIRNIKFLPDSIASFAPISLSGSVLGVGTIICTMIPLLTLAILMVAGSETLKGLYKKFIISALFAVLLLDLALISALYNFIPWLGFFIGIVILLVFILSQVVRPSANWTWLPMVIFVLVMILRMAGVINISKVNFAEVRPLDYSSSSAIALESLKEKPFLGTGPGTYGYNFSMHKPEAFNENMFYNLRFLQGSGLFFESASTIGGIGTFFLAILLLSFVSIEFYLIAREKEKNKLASLGLFAAAAILITGAFTTKLEGTILILGALIGTVSLATVLKESESQEKYLSLSLKASPKYALALAFVFMVVSAGVAFLFVFLGKVYAADIYAGSAARVGATNREGAVVSIMRAIRFYPQEGKYLITLGQYYMALANQETLKGEQERDVQKIKQYLNSSIAATNRGKEVLKYDVSATESLAAIYENAGLYVPDSYNLALENYQKALELEPHNPNFYLKMGAMKLNIAATKKDMSERKQLAAEAKDMFKKSTEKKKNLAEGYYQLAMVEDALGEKDSALENSRRAVELSPKRMDYVLALGRLYQGKGGEEDMKVAEQLFKAVTAQDDKNINGHFYLGLAYEKMKKKSEAKEEYKKVAELLPANSQETKNQLNKMMSNIDAGIENTPQTLGLVAGESSENASGETSEPPAGE